MTSKNATLLVVLLVSFAAVVTLIQNYPELYSGIMNTIGGTSAAACSSGTVPNPSEDQECGTYWQLVQNLAGSAQSPPAIQNFNDELIIVARGSDDALYAVEWNVTNSSIIKDWYKLAGSTSTSPKLVVSSNLYLFAQGKDGNIYNSTFQSPGSWSSFVNTGICNSNFGSAGPSSVIASDDVIYNASGTNPIYLNNCSTVLRARVFSDSDKNGVYDSGESYFQDPSASCADGIILNGLNVSWTGPSNGTALINKCDPHPLASASLQPGTYSVSVKVPLAWNVTSQNPVTAEITAGSYSDVSFGIDSTAIICETCYQNTICKCKLNITCTDGIWSAENKEDEPLNKTVTLEIPPKDFEFETEAAGKVEVKAICFAPNASVSTKVIDVNKGFLICPDDCPVKKYCSCTVNGCYDGNFTAVQGDKILTQKEVTSGSFKPNFMPMNLNDIDVDVTCFDPARIESQTISVYDTSPPTTTNPPPTTTHPGETTTTRMTTTTIFATTTTNAKPDCPFECCPIDDVTYSYKPCPSALQECQNRKCVSTSQGEDNTGLIIAIVILIVIIAAVVYFLFLRKRTTEGSMNYDDLKRKWRR